MTKKVVLNRCYGGFGLSDKAYKLYAEKKGLTVYLERKNGYSICWIVPEDERESKGWRDCVLYYDDIERDDPDLVAVVEELGDEANGECAKLEVVEAYVGFSIGYYDGMESIE